MSIVGDAIGCLGGQAVNATRACADRPLHAAKRCGAADPASRAD
jgi:hypothetical protein